MRINIGTTCRLKPDDINIDIMKYPGVTDIVANVLYLPIKSNVADEIFSCEMLEHIEHRQYKSALREIYRILKPGGKLDIETLDMEAIAREYIVCDEEHKRFLQMQYIYGGQDRPTEFHKCGFCELTLKKDLEEIGFINVKRFGEQGLRFIACKKEGLYANRNNI